jgi:hypothetical protein
MATQARITLTAEDKASAVIGKVRDQMTRTAASAQELSAAAGMIGPAFVALGSAVGLVTFVKNIFDAVDALNDVKDATGASIEGLSSLERVARQNGQTLDDVSGILVKFNKALQDAGDPKSDAAGVFSALGLSVKELKAADPAEALQKTAVALAGFADNGNKARIIQELFGKSIRQAAPFLKDLAEAGKVNATVTTEQAEQAERFNKALFALRANSEDARRALVLNLVAPLSETTDKFKAAIAAFGGFGAALGAVLSGYTQLKDDPSAGLVEYNKQLTVLDAKIKAVRDGSDGFLGRFADQRIASLQKERDEVSKVAGYYRALVNAGSAGAGRGDNIPGRPSLPASTKPAGPPAKREIDEATKSLASYVEQLDKELTKGEELTVVQEALNKLKSLGALGEVPQVREVVLAMAGKVQSLKDQDELEKGITAELDRQAKARAELDKALDAFSGRSADALKQAQTARLEARLSAGEVFSPEELDRIVKGIAGIKDEAEKTFDAAGKSLERFAENVQDALGTTIEDTLTGNFNNIGKLWSNLLIKMASQAIAADIASNLFGDMAKTGTPGGLFQGFMAAVTGGVFHGGGMVGSASSSRAVSPLAFAGAHRYHTGGLVGDEVPAILQRGEGVFTAGQMKALGAAMHTGGGRVAAITLAPQIQIDARSDQAQIAQLIGGAMAQSQRDMWAQLHARGLA